MLFLRLPLCAQEYTGEKTPTSVQLDVSTSTHSSTTYKSLEIQLVQNAPDDGPVRSETCRANTSAEYTHSLKNYLYLVGLHIYSTTPVL